MPPGMGPGRVTVQPRRNTLGLTIAGAVLAVVIAAAAFWFFTRDTSDDVATGPDVATAPNGSAPTTDAPGLPPSVPPGSQPSVPPTSAPKPVDTWTNYRAPDSSFTVTAPETPQVASQDVPVGGRTITQNQYLFATSYDSGILIGVARMPGVTANESAVLQGTLKGMEATGLTVTQQRPSKVGGNRSIAYTGTFNRGGQSYDVRGHVFLHGSRQFVILAQNVTDPLSVAVYNRFMASFRTG